MDLGMPVSRRRCLAVWGTATLGATGLVAWSLPVALAGPGDTFDTVLVRGCAAAVTAATCWLWVVATVVTTDALRGLVTVRRGIPAGVRTVLLVLGGAALASGLASPVVAAGQGPAGPHVLAGLRLPERVAVAPAAVAAPLASPTETAVEVAPGDALWDIAAHRLGAGASWPAIYALNRDVIGPDPGVIRPGQRLVLPSGSTGGSR